MPGGGSDGPDSSQRNQCVGQFLPQSRSPKNLTKMKECPTVSDEKKDLKIEYSDQVKEQMEKNPKVAAMVRDLAAAFRQAQDGVDRGQYRDIMEGVEKITGMKPERIEDDDA